MALEFNVGELATRLRASLGVRGRMPLALDEYVIPVALAANVTTPPWRSNPRFAQASLFAQLPAASGIRVSMSLRFQSAGSSAGRNDVFVLTGFTVQPLNIVAATGAASPGNAAWVKYRPATILSHSAQQTPLISTEGTAPVTTLPQMQLPVVLGSTQSVIADNPDNSAEGMIWYGRAGVVQPPVLIPTETLLRQGDSIEFTTPLTAAATDSAGLAVQVQGLYYGLGG